MNQRSEPVRLTLILLFALLTLNAPARADWQFTKWGMTPAQVVKASKGTARSATPEETSASAPVGSNEAVLAIIPAYSSGDLQFLVRFYFDRSGKLCRVGLKLLSPDKGFDLQNALIGKYGKPTIPDDDGGVWLTDRDHIALSREVGILQYAARATASSGGL
jgi:hypothetical protein